MRTFNRLLKDLILEQIVPVCSVLKFIVHKLLEFQFFLLKSSLMTQVIDRIKFYNFFQLTFYFIEQKFIFKLIKFKMLNRFKGFLN